MIQTLLLKHDGVSVQLKKEQRDLQDASEERNRVLSALVISLRTQQTLEEEGNMKIRRGGGNRRHLHYSTQILQDEDDDNIKMMIMQKWR